MRSAIELKKIKARNEMQIKGTYEGEVSDDGDTAFDVLEGEK